MAKGLRLYSLKMYFLLHGIFCGRDMQTKVWHRFYINLDSYLSASVCSKWVLGENSAGHFKVFSKNYNCPHINLLILFLSNIET